jgi:hypothetical protein
MKKKHYPNINIRMSYTQAQRLTLNVFRTTDQTKIIQRQLLTHWLYIWRNYSSTADRLHGLLVRVPGSRSRDPGSIPVATRFSKK